MVVWWCPCGFGVVWGVSMDLPVPVFSKPCLRHWEIQQSSANQNSPTVLRHSCNTFPLTESFLLTISD